MRKIKLVAALALMVCMMPTFAEGVPYQETEPSFPFDVIRPRFSNIIVFNNDFYINSSGEAVMSSTLDAHGVDEGKITVYLQRYQNGSWVNVKTFSSRKSGGFVTLSESYSVSRGYSYRMKSYGNVYKNGSVVEGTSFVSTSEVY